MQLTDACKLLEENANNDPAIANCNDEPITVLRTKIIECIDYCDRQIQNAKENIMTAEECINTYEQAQAMFEKLLACCKGAENDT